MTTKKKLQGLHGLGRKFGVYGTEESPEAEYSGEIDSWGEGLHLKAEIRTKENRAAVDFKAKGRRATLVAGISFVLILAFAYLFFPLIMDAVEKLLEVINVAHGVLEFLIRV